MANKENIKKWVDALESGEYDQTEGSLRNRYGFCCLGVACDLAVKAGVIDEPVVDGIGVHEYEDVDSHLPNSVYEWLGFEVEGEGNEQTIHVVTDPSYPEETTDVISLNDTQEYDFNQIAQAVRETFLDTE